MSDAHQYAMCGNLQHRPISDYFACCFSYIAYCVLAYLCSPDGLSQSIIVKAMQLWYFIFYRRPLSTNKE